MVGYTVPCKNIHPLWHFSYFVALQPVIYVTDIHKIVQIGEVKLFVKMYNGKVVCAYVVARKKAIA